MSKLSVKLRSAAIPEVGYDDGSRLLTVFFSSGRRAVYAGVPRQVFNAIVHAQSPGRYYNQVVKKKYKRAEPQRRTSEMIAR